MSGDSPVGTGKGQLTGGKRPGKLKQLSVQSATRSEDAYSFLYDGIRSRRFASGVRLVEEEIAQLLKVSRTPVREALHRLASRGLVEARQGRGFFVATLDRRQIFELYAFREVIEGAAARFAAQYATPPEIESLYRINEQLLLSSDDVDALHAINRRFHQAVNDASHNQYLIYALNELHDAFALMRETTLSVPGRAAAAFEEHLALIKALERRQGDVAEGLLKDHVRKAQQIRLTMVA
ncbi:GntR family transcriptional regulator [soil metagenome]